MLKSFEGTSWDKVLPWMLICPSGRYCYARQKDDLWFARISVAPRCDCVPNLDVVTNALDLCFCENRPCFDAKLSDAPPCTLKIKEDLHTKSQELTDQTRHESFRCCQPYTDSTGEGRAPASCSIFSCSPPHLSELSPGNCHSSTARRGQSSFSFWTSAHADGPS